MEITSVVEIDYGLQKVGHSFYPPSFKTQLKEIFTKFLGFLLIPGKELKEFRNRCP